MQMSHEISGVTGPKFTKFVALVFFSWTVLTQQSALRSAHPLSSNMGDIFKPDGCIVWNEHNTVFSLKAICAQAVYFLCSTMFSVTCLRLSDVSVICRVTYLQFLIQAGSSFMSVIQAAQRRSWFTQYRTSDFAEMFGR